MPRGLPPGALAPDFALRDAVAGGEYTLGALLARGPLVLAFLPAADSPQIAAARGACGRVRDAGMTLAAIVCQDAYRAVAHFAETPEKPPFPVLVDAARATARAYGVTGSLFLPARPAVFVIAPDRRILACLPGEGIPDAPSLKRLAALAAGVHAPERTA